MKINMAKEQTSCKLAILGGTKAVNIGNNDIFKWPIVTKEHEKAVCDVLNDRNMSGINITKQFESEYAKWHGIKYGLGCNNGTAALYCSFYGLGIGNGDEVIGPSFTYWASMLPVLALRAKAVFADINDKTLCLDAEDVERKITPRTKAIVVVHYASMPADMDSIMNIAKKHNLKVIEDVSHAQGGFYKGKLLGTFGDVSASSLMTGKSFAIGEGGIMLTNDKKIYERALLFGHYERHDAITLDELKPYIDLPCGGHKFRMHQASAAFGIIQLKHYKKQIAEIDKAMTYFSDKIDKINGIKCYRVDKNSGSTNGGWYCAMAKYDKNKLSGLSLAKFVEALNSEGVPAGAGGNRPLHLHPVFNEMDIYRAGMETNKLVNGFVKEISLPVTESINDNLIMLPWFKHYKPDVIDEYVKAFEKVVNNYEELLETDNCDKTSGNYSNLKRHANNK